jgi:outer membrane lipoprotein-sorting protein
MRRRRSHFKTSFRRRPAHHYPENVLRLPLLVLLTSLLPLRAEPQPVSPTELAHHDAAFSAVQRDTRTFHADVTQTLHLQGLARPIASTGTLDYVGPDKLLIRFTQPAGEWMLVNGTVAVVKKTGKPLERHDLSSQGRSATHAASLLDFFHADPARWHRDFDVSMTRDGDRLFVHLKPWMTPTATAQGVEQIVTTLQLPSYAIVEMNVTLGGANSIDYQFAHGARNAAIDPALFQVPAP